MASTTFTTFQSPLLKTSSFLIVRGAPSTSLLFFLANSLAKSLPILSFPKTSLALLMVLTPSRTFPPSATTRNLTLSTWEMPQVIFTSLNDLYLLYYYYYYLLYYYYL